MKKRIIILICVGFLVFTIVGCLPRLKPEDVVGKLYTKSETVIDPFTGLKNEVYPHLKAEYFVKDLAAFIREQKDPECDEEPRCFCLEYDPLVGGQDFAITKFKITPESVNNDKALVRVTLVNLGTPKDLKFQLVREDGVWRIANLTSVEFTNLRKAMEDCNMGNY